MQTNLFPAQVAATNRANLKHIFRAFDANRLGDEITQALTEIYGRGRAECIIRDALARIR